MIRYFCSKRVCSRPLQWSHKLCKPRPAMLRSTLHNKQRAKPSMTLLFLGNPTKSPTTPDTKKDGFNVLIGLLRTKPKQKSLKKNLSMLVYVKLRL